MENWKTEKAETEDEKCESFEIVGAIHSNLQTIPYPSYLLIILKSPEMKNF